MFVVGGHQADLQVGRWALQAGCQAAHGGHSASAQLCHARTLTRRRCSTHLLFFCPPSCPQWFRHYNHRTGKLIMLPMSSPRWYPSLVTLPNGLIMAIGGVKKSGVGGWGGAGFPQYNK